MREKPPLLAPGVELEPVLGDPEGLFRTRLGRTELRTSIFAVIVIALGVFMLWMYVRDPGEDVPLSGLIALFAISGAFILFGLRLLWGAATSGRRNARLLRTLNERPDRVARIFAAVMRQRPGVHR